MAKTIIGRKGREITLLNPSEKGQKFADELRNGVALTNDQHLKFDESGRPQKLTDTQRAWRRGYLAARKDSADCWKAKQKKR